MLGLVFSFLVVSFLTFLCFCLCCGVSTIIKRVKSKGLRLVAEEALMLFFAVLIGIILLGKAKHEFLVPVSTAEEIITL